MASFHALALVELALVEFRCIPDYSKKLFQKEGRGWHHHSRVLVTGLLGQGG